MSTRRLRCIAWAGAAAITILAWSAIFFVLIVLIGCATKPVPVPVLPVLDPVAAQPLADQFAERIARARADLADATESKAAHDSLILAAAQAKAEAPLRALLTWAQWAGGALVLVGVLALGLSLSPWGAWVPGGRATALIAVATGFGIVVSARSLAAVLALAWLPWAVLGLGVLVLLALALRRVLRLHAAGRSAAGELRMYADNLGALSPQVRTVLDSDSRTRQGTSASIVDGWLGRDTVKPTKVRQA